MPTANRKLLTEVVATTQDVMRCAGSTHTGELTMQGITVNLMHSKHREFAEWLVGEQNKSDVGMTSAFRSHDWDRGGSLDVKELERAVMSFMKHKNREESTAS